MILIIIRILHDWLLAWNLWNTRRLAVKLDIHGSQKPIETVSSQLCRQSRDHNKLLPHGSVKTNSKETLIQYEVPWVRCIMEGKGLLLWCDWALS